MREPSVVNGHIWLVSDPMYGAIKKSYKGVDYLVPFSGAWVPEEPAWEFATTPDRVYCTRVGDFIIKQVVVFGSPSEMEMRHAPKERIGNASGTVQGEPTGKPKSQSGRSRRRRQRRAEPREHAVPGDAASGSGDGVNLDLDN